MGVVELEVTRTVAAPIDEVFARLADIEGYNDWMPRKGSIRRHSEQTSPGPSAVGTAYVDSTLFGPTPGEIAEYEPPHTLVFHWWDRTKKGKTLLEGWPAYSLESTSDGGTVVRQHATLHTHGRYRPATPMLGFMARRERTAIMEALVASFEPQR